MDERKNNMFKQNKKREKQKKTHESELENISKYIKEVFLPHSMYLSIMYVLVLSSTFQTCEMYDMEEKEMKLAAKREAYV